MRLDLFLKKSGIIKRRTVAKELAEKSLAKINDKIAKPSSDLKENDLLELKLGPRLVRVRVHFENKGKLIVPTFEEIK